MNLVNLQEKASVSLSKGEYSEAIALYELCIEAEPSYLMNYWQLGLANFFQGDEIAAESIWLSGLLQINSEEQDLCIAELLQLLKDSILIQVQAKKLQVAEKLCLQALKISDNIPEVYYYLAYCLRCRGEGKDALEYLKRAIELNPNYAEAYSALGSLIIDMWKSESDAAITYVQRAIELKPDWVEPYYNMGVCLMEKGKMDSAIHYFQKAIELKPNLADAYYRSGFCLRRKGEIDAARDKLREAIVLKPELSKTASTVIEQLVKCEASGYAPQIRQGYNIWDAMLFKDDNLYRLFYLMGDGGASPFWSVGEVGAAISYDMKKWEYIGVVLKPDTASEWQSGRILAGSVYKENGIYYFFYSASSPAPLLLSEGIGIATSTDGISWQAQNYPIINLDSGEGFYSYSVRDSFGEEKKHFACRDPYIFKDITSQNYYMFMTASSPGESYQYRGCIGLAVSSKIDGSYKVLPPVLYPKIPETDEGIFYEMERPQVIYRDGKYHLFFSCDNSMINPKWIKQVRGEEITNWQMYWYVSENLRGPFVPSSANPVVKGSEKIGLYGINFIEAPNGKLIACGCYGSTGTLEVSPRFPVRWENGNIEIIVE